SLSTGYSLLKQVSIKRPELMIQVGVAGCFDKKYKPGAVVSVEQDVLADLGVIENKEFRSVFDLGLSFPNQLPHKNGWLKNVNSSLLKRTGLPRVKGITVNQV